jgi:hypothetical protein
MELHLDGLLPNEFSQWAVPAGSVESDHRAYDRLRKRLQGTLGIRLPTGNIATIGRNLTWNNTVQYRIFKKIWPEAEVNFTHYYQGSHGGNTSVYFTPGVVLGRFHLWDRLGFTVGRSFQIAATSFHPTNHIPILSVRFPF